MEGVAAASAIASLILLGGKVTSQAHGFLNKVKDCPKRVKNIETDLRSTTSILEKLEKTLKESSASEVIALEDKRDEFRTTIDGVEEVYNELAVLISKYDGFTLWKRAKWASVGLDEATHLGRLLSTQKQNLGFLLILAQGDTLSSIRSGVGGNSDELRVVMSQLIVMRSNGTGVTDPRLDSWFESVAEYGGTASVAGTVPKSRYASSSTSSSARSLLELAPREATSTTVSGGGAVDLNSSAMNRMEGKPTESHRVFLNWARKQQEQGLPLTEDVIRAEVRTWAAATESVDERSLEEAGAIWLQRFRRNIVSGRIVSVAKFELMLKNAPAVTNENMTTQCANACPQLPPVVYRSILFLRQVVWKDWEINPMWSYPILVNHESAFFDSMEENLKVIKMLTTIASHKLSRVSVKSSSGAGCFSVKKARVEIVLSGLRDVAKALRKIGKRASKNAPQDRSIEVVVREITNCRLCLETLIDTLAAPTRDFDALNLDKVQGIIRQLDSYRQSWKSYDESDPDIGKINTRSIFHTAVVPRVVEGECRTRIGPASKDSSGHLWWKFENDGDLDLQSLDWQKYGLSEQAVNIVGTLFIHYLLKKEAPIIPAAISSRFNETWPFERLDDLEKAIQRPELSEERYLLLYHLLSFLHGIALLAKYPKEAEVQLSKAFCDVVGVSQVYVCHLIGKHASILTPPYQYRKENIFSFKAPFPLELSCMPPQQAPTIQVTEAPATEKEIRVETLASNVAGRRRSSSWMSRFKLKNHAEG